MTPAAPAELLTPPAGACTLRGALTFDTVPLLWQASARLFAADPGSAELILNLAGVERTDSAGLALLVAWQAQARADGRRLRYEAIPAPLLAIARISEVDALLRAG